MMNDYENENTPLVQLSKPNVLLGRFFNPVKQQMRSTGICNFLKWLIYRDKRQAPKDKRVLDQVLPVNFITDNEIEKFCNTDTSEKTLVIWIGHATSLINFQNKIILMDPIISKRSSPLGKMARKRYRPVPITIGFIPHIDAVIISHNHFDHLDTPTIKHLKNWKSKRNNQNEINWFVGKGLKKWFESTGIESSRINELNWWESVQLDHVRFTFTPAHHWSMRFLFDFNKTLWGSWSLIGPKKKVFFAGDTAYCARYFQEIGEHLGPFDLSFIPIGAYEPREILGNFHIDPEFAVQVHKDVKSKKSIGIHWGTMKFGKEYYLAPPAELNLALEKSSLNKNDFMVVKHGEIFEF